jgi:hypothetical protein
MKLQLESTGAIALVDGACRCRVWKGTTESGGEIVALVAAIGCDPADATLCAELDRELLAREEITITNGGVVPVRAVPG